MTTKDTVILLHGITVTRRIMKPLELALKKSGYRVRNITYPSVTYTLETLVEYVAHETAKEIHGTRRVHFVGHSMGGLLIRLLLKKHRPKNLGRVVMLGTPNHGSKVADFLERFEIFRRYLGPAGKQIGTDIHAIHNKLPPVDYECGVIAGNRSVEPWFSWFLFGGERNDGKVSIESTKVEGMTDFKEVAVAHSALPKNKQVIWMIEEFLKHGKFEAI